MKIYGNQFSWNCQKIKFVADYLAPPQTSQETNLLEGESRTPEYLDNNPQDVDVFVDLFYATDIMINHSRTKWATIAGSSSWTQNGTVRMPPKIP